MSRNLFHTFKEPEAYRACRCMSSLSGKRNSPTENEVIGVGVRKLEEKAESQLFGALGEALLLLKIWDPLGEFGRFWRILWY